MSWWEAAPSPEMASKTSRHARSQYPLELAKKEKDKLAKELASAGAEAVSTALAAGIAFKATYYGIVTISSAAGGGPMAESINRLVKEELDRRPAYVIMSADDFFVVHQKGAELITGHMLRDIQYMGPAPEADNVFGCVKRTPLGVLLCLFLEPEAPVTDVLKALSTIIEPTITGKEMENPVDTGLQSGLRRRMSTLGQKEVIEREPWFVGSASSAVVEKGLESGMVGDYVVRESVSTPGAYVLVIKLSPTEFIQQKIQKTGAGTYAIDGNPEKFATLGKLISSVSEASRPAGDTVLGKTKRNSTSIDVRTDVKSFDALYLGSTLVYDRRDITIETGKEVVKRSVIENSDARKELKSAMAKSKAGKRHEVLKQTTPSGALVMDENPVTIVLTPRLVRVVERSTGEVLNRFFIRSIPFTYEAPGRQGGFDKFALITKDNELGQVECHILNVLKGYGHLLAEAIFFYIDQAEATFNEKEVKAHNPFTAQGERIAAPPRLYAKQIHRADIEPVMVIGAGQFGEVWKGMQAVKMADGSVVKKPRAIKLLKGGASVTDRDEFVREAETMLDFDHDNVIRIIGVAVQQSPWLSVLEFMCYGDLQKLVRMCKTKQLVLDRGEMLDFCAQVCRGCGYITSLRLVHMDIAARNVLVGANNTVKVADFGLTRPMDRDKDYYRLRERLTISVKWSAYEALKRKMFNEKSDLWSYGVCAWEVFTYGDVPYRSVPLTQVVAEMTKGTRPARPPGCPVDIWKYIATCWHPDVSKRWDFVQALAEVMTLLEKHPLKQPRRDIGKALKEKKLDVPVSV